MKFLCIGDVVGQPGLTLFRQAAPYLKRKYEADFIIVNGENCHHSGVGITQKEADELLNFADVVTTGNHCYRRAGEELYGENPAVLHPANYPYTDDENGCCTIDMGRLGTVCVINLAGISFLEPIDNPFKRVDDLLKKTQAKFTLVDFHAEASAEKQALAHYLDGRVSIVFGTHTHVQTADDQILPKQTGYITDLGMTGPIHSVIGVRPALAIQRQKDHVPVQMQVHEGPCMLNAALFTLDDVNGRCIAVQRIDYRPLSSN